MPLNSVNTNIGAQVALRSLNNTTTDLAATQKRISTGLRVADASDDGGTFAVAERVRSDVGVLTTVNQQLGNVKGLAEVTESALTGLSKELGKARELLVVIGNNVSDKDTRDAAVKDYGALVTRVAAQVDAASYNGQSLLGKTGASQTAAQLDRSIINSEAGTTSKLQSSDSQGLANALAGLIGGTFVAGTGAGSGFNPNATAGGEQAAAATAISTTGAGTFAAVQDGVSSNLGKAGANSKFLDATIKQNAGKIDSLNAGLGALVDADLAKESAQLQALQIRQQLGTQALSLANQAPQSLLSLFK